MKSKRRKKRPARPMPSRQRSRIELLEPRIVLAGEPLTETEQFSLLYSGLDTLDDFGERLQSLVDAAAPTVGLLGESLVDGPLTSVADLGAMLREVANRAKVPPQITFADGLSDTSPTYTDIGAGFDLYVLVDGSESHQVRVSPLTGVTGTLSQRALAWRAHLNGALANAGLSGRMEWLLVDLQGESAPALSLVAKAGSGITNLTATTARIDATGTGPLLGQLPADASFRVRLTLATLVGDPEDESQPTPVEIVVPAVGTDAAEVRVLAGRAGTDGTPTSEDNVDLSDLADDINAAFRSVQVQYPNAEFAASNRADATDPFPDPNPATGGLAAPSTTRNLATYLEAIVVPARGGTPRHLAIVARHADVIGFELSGAGLATFGLAPAGGGTTRSVNERNLGAFTHLFVQGANGAGGINRELAGQLARGDISLDSAVTTVIRLLHPAASFENGIVRLPVDLAGVSEGSVRAAFNRTIGLGTLGNLELSGHVDAVASAATSGRLYFEIVLAESVDGSGNLTERSLLSELPGGQGALLAVGVAATKEPLSETPAGNSPLTMALKIEDQSGAVLDVEISIPRAGRGPLPVSPSELLAALQEGLESATVVGKKVPPIDLSDRIEARMLGGRIHLRAIDRKITMLQIVGNLPATRLLGFAANQASSDPPNKQSLPIAGNQTAYPDLEIRVGSGNNLTTYYVSLDGERTIRDALNAITRQTPNDVQAKFEDGAIVLYANSPIAVAPAKSFGILSGAAMALGIVGSSRFDTATNRHVLRGISLNAVPVTDRVSLVPDGASGGLAFNVGLDAADNRLGAALGAVSMAGTWGDPLHVGYQLNVNLFDPLLDPNRDGRISWAEISGRTIGSALGPLSPIAATVSGTLELSANLFDDPATEATDYQYSSSLAELQFSLADPTNLASIQVVSNDQGFNSLLSQLRQLSVNDFLALARGTIDKLHDGPAAELLSKELPLVGRSIGDVVDVARDLSNALDQVVSQVDVRSITDQLGRIQTAITNLPIAPEAKVAALDAVGEVRRVIAGGPAGDSTFVSRLIAQVGALEQELERLLREPPAAVPQATAAASTAGTLSPSSTPVVTPLAESQGKGSVAGSAAPSAPVSAAPVSARLFMASARGSNPAGKVATTQQEQTPLQPLVQPLVQPAVAAAPVATPLAEDTEALDPVRQELQDELDALKQLLPTVNDIGKRIADAVRNTLPHQQELTVRFDVIPDADPATGNQPALVVGLEGALAPPPLRFDPDIGPNSLGPISVDLGVDAQLMVAAEFGVGLAVVLTNSGPVPLVVTDAVAGNDNLVPTKLRVTARAAGAGSAGVRFGSLDALDGSMVLALGSGPELASPASISLGLTGGSGPLRAAPLASLVGESTIDGSIEGHVDVSGLGFHVPNAVSLNVPLDDISNAQADVNEAALSGLFEGLEFDLRTIVDGISAYLDLLADALKKELSQLPVVGGGLDDLGGLVSGLRDKLVEPLREDLENLGLSSFEQVEQRIATFLATAFGEIFDGMAAAQSSLAPIARPLISADDFDVEVDSDHFQIRKKTGLQGTISREVPFKTNLGGLPMAAEGGVTANLSYNIDFGFGIDRIAGFYLVTSDAPEFSFSIDAGLAQGSSLELDLFLLRVKATKLVSGQELEAKVEFDLGGAGRTYLPDVVFDAGISAGVNLNLQLTAAPGLDLPKVGATLEASWGVSIGEVSSPVSAPQTPTLALNEITLDLGQFFRQYISPTLDTLHDAIEPLAPVIDFLDSDVPGLSQLAQLAGQDPVTFLDLALLEASPEDAAAASKFVSVLRAIKDVANVVNSLTQGDDHLLRFGSISVTGDGLNSSGWNLSVLSSPTGTPQASPLADGNIVFDASGLSSLSGVLAGLNSELDHALSKISTPPSDVAEDDDGLGIELPILDPTNVVRLLLGQVVDVITWDIPRVSLGFGWSQKFPVLAFPPISVEVGLDLGFTLDLFVGLDTRGLQTDNFFDGFYFGDLENGGTGADIDEAVFQLGVSLAALLDLGVASAGVEGEIIGRLRANWRDPDKDGKLYFDELEKSLSDSVCLFDLTADVRVVIRLVWEILFASGSIDIIDLTLLEIDNKALCPPNAPAHVSDGMPVDDRNYRNTLPEHLVGVYGDGVEVAPAGTLILHAGGFADMRTRGASSDTAEAYTITYLAPGVVNVEGMGLSERYGGVERILFDGGRGNDQLVLRMVEEEEDPDTQFPIPIYAVGGAGNDVLHGGMRSDKLFGDAGSDELHGGSGADEIHGGTDNDLLYGDDGTDQIFGEDGNDTIYGGGSADTISGGAGHDTIYGFWSPDNVPDATGGDGGDTIHGDEGADTVFGGPGDDIIFGDGNNDILSGEAGRDIIDGGDGHDLIDGGDHDDPWLHGGLGNDLIIGGPGSDALLGGWGEDAIVAHMVDIGSVGGAQYSDYIEGGPDDDFICGSDGNDTILGGTGDLGFRGLPLLGIPGVHFEPNLVYPVETGGYSMASCLDPKPDELGPAAPGAIAGTVFRDRNGDGIQGVGESLEQGWTINVYDSSGRFVTTLETAAIDLNEDGTIDPATEAGVYQLDGLDPGVYRFDLVVPRGVVGGTIDSRYRVTTTNAGSLRQTVLVASDGTTALPAFGVVAKPILRGRVWVDADGDGVRDPGESGLEGITVFVDLDHDGFIDNAAFRFEPEQTSRSDDPATPEDESGYFEILLEEPGQYFLRQDRADILNLPTPGPGAWVTTYPARQVLYDNDFDGAAGAEWGAATKSTTPSGEELLGPFGNDPVVFRLGDLPPHTGFLLEFDLYIIGSWDGNDPVNPDRWQMDVTGGTGNLIDTTFRNVLEPDEFNAYQSYPGMYNSTNPPQNPPRAGADPNRVNDIGFGASAVYHLSRTFSHNLDDLEILFRGRNLSSSENERWALDNFRITVLDQGHLVDVDWEDVIDDLDFGNRFAPFGGQAFAASPGLSPAAASSLAGAPQFVGSAESGTGSITSLAEQIIGSPLVVSADEPMWVVSGEKWHDLNADGIMQANEPPIRGVTVYVDLNGNAMLDADEPSAVTRNNGKYELMAPLGTVTIREVVPDGWRPTYPGVRPVAITSDGRLAEFDFTNSGSEVAHVRALKTPDGPVTNWIGMTTDPRTGVVYAVGSQHNAAVSSVPRPTLFRIDPDTSTAERVFVLPEGLSEGDLAIDPTSGNLFALYRENADGVELVRINLTNGRIESVGVIQDLEFVRPVDPSAMAFDSNGDLWILDTKVATGPTTRGVLWRVDKSNAAIIGTSTLPVTSLGRVAGMVFQPNSSKLLIVAGDPESGDRAPGAYTYFTNTGQFLVAGQHNLPLSGLAMVPNIGHITTVVSTIPPATERRFDFGNLAVTEIPDGRDHIEGHRGTDTIYGDNHIDPSIIFLQRLRLLGDNDTIFGGPGSDTIFGNQGDDQLWGSDDHSPGVAPGGSPDDDTLDGGDGIDTVHQWVSADQTLENDRLLGQGTDTLSNIESAELIAGATGFELDASAFTLGGVTLRGGAGQDTLIGTNNADVLEGGGDSDTMSGGDGDDVYVFANTDTLEEDHVDDTEGFDTLDFSKLTSAVGISLELGAAVLVDDVHRRLTTNTRNMFEKVIGTAGNDNIVGTFGNDWLEGGPGNDTLRGGAGHDYFDGGPGSDTLDGGDGNDEFYFGPAVGEEIDRASGGDGADTLDFSESDGRNLRVTLNSTVMASHDGRVVRVYTTFDFERVLGTPYDDTFVDSPLAEYFAGGDGDDRYIFGQSTALDTILELPGGGTDTIDFSPRTDRIFVDLSELTVLAFAFEPALGNRVTSALGFKGFIENAIGGSGDDSLIGSPVANRLEGGPGSDILNGGNGPDTYLFGDTGAGPAETDEIRETGDGSTDILDFSALTQGLTVNLATGSAAHGLRQLEFANNSIREVWAGRGNDELFGSVGNDRLVGGPGDDILDGGPGNDTLVGGAGDDTYRFSPLIVGSPAIPGIETDLIFDPDLELNADGTVCSNALGQPISASGGEDTLDFSPLTSDTVFELRVNLAGVPVAFHRDPRNSLNFRQVFEVGSATALENVIGSGGHDLIVGNDRDNVLQGGPGDDTLQGGRGNDWLNGDAGSNTLIGGPHDDTYAFSWFTPSANRLVEGPGSVRNGLLTPGGRDTIDLIGALTQVEFDLSHFDPDAMTVPSEWDPGVTLNTRIDLHDDSGDPADDETRNGTYFEQVLIFSGPIEMGATPGVATAEIPPDAAPQVALIQESDGNLASAAVLRNTQSELVVGGETTRREKVAAGGLTDSVRRTADRKQPELKSVVEETEDLLSLLSSSRSRKDASRGTAVDLVFANLADDLIDPLGLD